METPLNNHNSSEENEPNQQSKYVSLENRETVFELNPELSKTKHKTEFNLAKKWSIFVSIVLIVTLIIVFLPMIKIINIPAPVIVYFFLILPLFFIFKVFNISVESKTKEPNYYATFMQSLVITIVVYILFWVLNHFHEPVVPYIILGLMLVFNWYQAIQTKNYLMRTLAEVSTTVAIFGCLLHLSNIYYQKSEVFIFLAQILALVTTIIYIFLMYYRKNSLSLLAAYPTSIIVIIFCVFWPELWTHFFLINLIILSLAHLNFILWFNYECLDELMLWLLYVAIQDIYLEIVYTNLFFPFTIVLALFSITYLFIIYYFGNIHRYVILSYVLTYTALVSLCLLTFYLPFELQNIIIGSLLILGTFVYYKTANDYIKNWTRAFLGIVLLILIIDIFQNRLFQSFYNLAFLHIHYSIVLYFSRHFGKDCGVSLWRLFDLSFFANLLKILVFILLLQIMLTEHIYDYFEPKYFMYNLYIGLWLVYFYLLYVHQKVFIYSNINTIEKKLRRYKKVIGSLSKKNENQTVNKYPSFLRFLITCFLISSVILKLNFIFDNESNLANLNIESAYLIYLIFIYLFISVDMYFTLRYDKTKRYFRHVLMILASIAFIHINEDIYFIISIYLKKSHMTYTMTYITVSILVSVIIFYIGYVRKIQINRQLSLIFFFVTIFWFLAIDMWRLPSKITIVFILVFLVLIGTISFFYNRFKNYILRTVDIDINISKEEIDEINMQISRQENAK